MYNQVEFFRSVYARQYGPLNPPNPKGTVSYEIYALKLRQALAEWTRGETA
jgi:hypothetical protein